MTDAPSRTDATGSRSGLSAAQHRMLWPPHAVGDCTPAEVRQLVRLNLLERRRATDLYFVTAEGRRVREMEHNG